MNCTLVQWSACMHCVSLHLFWCGCVRLSPVCFSGCMYCSFSVICWWLQPVVCYVCHLASLICVSTLLWFTEAVKLKLWICEAVKLWSWCIEKSSGQNHTETRQDNHMLPKCNANNQAWMMRWWGLRKYCPSASLLWVRMSQSTLTWWSWSCEAVKLWSWCIEKSSGNKHTDTRQDNHMLQI